MSEEKKQNKADDIIKRMFKEIADSHFNDHKMISHYCNSVHLPRSLGDDISNWVCAYHPEYYYKKREEYKPRVIGVNKNYNE